MRSNLPDRPVAIDWSSPYIRHPCELGFDAIGLRDLLKRRRPLPDDVEAQLAAAASVLDEFGDALDEAMDIEVPDESELAKVRAHRVNWIGRCADNFRDAERAFREGRTDEAELLLGRATSKARIWPTLSVTPSLPIRPPPVGTISAL